LEYTFIYEIPAHAQFIYLFTMALGTTGGKRAINPGL
jgi:hypothetical protein